MNDAVLTAAIASTLLPGGALPYGVNAPAAGELLDESTLTDWLSRPQAETARAAILSQAGGAEAFIAATPDQRESILRKAEAQRPSSFQSLVTALLTLYYEHPAVLKAFGWRTAPPQPQGHTLAARDESLFAEVTARGPIWRKTD